MIKIRKFIEKTFNIEQRDVELLMEPFQIFINDLTNKGKEYFNYYHISDAIIEGNDWQFIKLSSGDLISEDCKKAHLINPVKIYIGIFKEGNYYMPSAGLISISINYNFLSLLFQTMNADYNEELFLPIDFKKLLMYTTLSNVDKALTEITPLKWENSIHHELAHWLDDTFHSLHIGKTLQKTKGKIAPYYGVKNINVSHMEIEAQIHSIKFLKQKFANVWDTFTIFDVLNKDTSMRFIYQGLPHEERKIWIDHLLKRMAREKLIGRNMTYIPSDDRILTEKLIEDQVNYIKPIYNGTIIEITKQLLEKNRDFEIKEFKEDLLEILYEYTISDLRSNAPNPHEKKFLKTRQKKGEQGSFLVGLSWNDRNKRAVGKERYTSTLTLTFKIQPTYKDSQGNYTKKGNQTGTKKNYQIKLQFQAINDWVESRQAFLEFTKGEQVEFIRGIIKGADIKIWSNDPSWLYQGHYENAVELDYSLYEWPGNIPRAKGRWAMIKTGSTTTPYFSLSKHMIEVLTVIPFIPDEIASMIRKEYGSD